MGVLGGGVAHLSCVHVANVFVLAIAAHVGAAHAVVKGVVAIYKSVDSKALTELGGREHGAGCGTFSHVSMVLQFPSLRLRADCRQSAEPDR